MLQQIKGRAINRPQRKTSRPGSKKRRPTGNLDQYEDRGPWKMPQPGAEEEVKPVVSPWYGQLDSYGFDDYDPEAKKLEEIKKSKVPFDGPAEPYVLSKEEPPPVPARTGESPHADARADLTKPSEYEMRLAAHDPDPDPPKILFVSGVNPFIRVADIADADLARVVGVARDLMAVSARARHGRHTTRSLDPNAKLWGYGRGGKPCRKCGAPIEARKTGADARLTYFCPQCQR